MTKGKTVTPHAPDSYELVGMRIQKIINAPAAQRAKSALLHRLPEEAANDWQRVIEEISETDNVTLAHRDDGGVQIFWVVPSDA